MDAPGLSLKGLAVEQELCLACDGVSVLLLSAECCIV